MTSEAGRERPTRPIRVLLADDHAGYRRSLSRLLEASGHFEVVAEAIDGPTAVAAAARVPIDVALIDDDMPGRGGALFVSTILELVPEACVLLLTMHSDERVKRAARRAGAAGTVSKRLPPETMIERVRAAARAKTPSMSDVRHERARSWSASIPELVPGLRIEPADRAPDVESARITLRAALRGGPVEALITPAELGRLVDESPRDLEGYRLIVAAKQLIRLQHYDPGLVRLTLLEDAGEGDAGGRWVARPEPFERLGGAVLQAAQPAVVVLGAPGSGKTTQLATLALELAVTGMRAESLPAPIPFQAHLGEVRIGPGRSSDLIDPMEWLEETWSVRFGSMPTLAELLSERPVVFLLDGVNEIPWSSRDERRRILDRWARFVRSLAAEHPGSRAIFTSRSLDYSQPLSRPEQPVPQIRIEALDDEQISGYLDRVDRGDPDLATPAVGQQAPLDVLRTPFFLRLYIETARRTDDKVLGRSPLIATLVRRLLVRDLERDEPLFRSDLLLSHDDRSRLLRDEWSRATGLPREGVLLRGLAALAHGMQASGGSGTAASVWSNLEDARRKVGLPNADAILDAGLRLDLLRYRRRIDRLVFAHQLLQEFFAALAYVDAPRPELTAVEWRASHVEPSLETVVETMATSDELPPPPPSGWEESLLMAAELSDDPERLIRDLMPHNLVLSARCAAQSSVRPSLAASLLGTLRDVLVGRSRDPDADLRHRIACGFALGRLGDPRLRPWPGPEGECLVPPMVAIPGGTYPIGQDEEVREGDRFTRDHIPGHHISIAGFAIGRFPVTNAEFKRFVAAGGYEDERWWDTEAGREWRRGIGTSFGRRYNLRHWVHKFKGHPERLRRYLEEGAWTEEQYEGWCRRVEMSDDELDEYLETALPESVHREPRSWRLPEFSNPDQPVVSICWYEARAYCHWLAAQTSAPFRLPTEVEWEAAARGVTGRAFTTGDSVPITGGNLVDLKTRRPTPIGVFVEGDTPEGVSDLMGNVFECTSSAAGRGYELVYSYPYRADDGREDADVGPDVTRVARGASWTNTRLTRAVVRSTPHPSSWNEYSGFRLALGPLGDDQVTRLHELGLEMGETA
jgi:formylglycine-generating enzyme required for sulfatase activity/DNA-binding NarL/FixJ family response regulator